jgi:diguanylate cyclase (GGDEF)-like protein
MLATTAILTIYNNNRLGAILEESVRSELLAICYAARDNIDPELVLSISSEASMRAHQAEVDAAIARLRVLKDEVGATYIYVVKEIGDEYYFVLDTDEEAGTPDNPVFSEYDIAAVHEQAFDGKSSADVMNVEDEWGSYNTGAVPLYRYGDSGEIIGVVSADIEDTYIERSRQTAMVGTVALVAVLLVAVSILLGLLIMLLRRNQRMQDDLFHIANHDAITQLYNRRYLFTYLCDWSKSSAAATAAFAIMFIDLDNFKRINDNAGHNEGDRLLRLIAQFLKTYSAADKHDGGIDAMTVRIGGDEFLQILPGVSTAEAAERRARALIDDFMKEPELLPFIEQFGIGLSIGGALFPAQADDYNELIRFADIAMYQAKYGGKNNYALYDESMGDGPEGIVLAVRGGGRKADDGNGRTDDGNGRTDDGNGRTDTNHAQ